MNVVSAGVLTVALIGLVFFHLKKAWRKPDKKTGPGAKGGVGKNFSNRHPFYLFTLTYLN